MSNKISVVINTLNEEKNVERAINSVDWADEIVVCDMHSQDKTVEIARKLGAKVVFNKKEEYVELVRNSAISKASNEWILILDPDEQLPESLSKRLIQIAEKMKEIDYVRIPRKNIIFNKWMKASGWWPDYNIRFFKKGSVQWSDKIHIPPKSKGAGLDLSAEEEYALVHHHYSSITQFVERLNRYTSVQSRELREQGYSFQWQDLIQKPLGEFLRRFFASRGFKDGLHGLALSLLQAFSYLIVYLKIWEAEKFKEQEVDLSGLNQASKQAGEEIDYWFKYGNLSKNPFKRFFQKVKNKI